MRLVSFTLTNYRRFLNTEVLETRQKLTAIVGPNEAGKTALLRAFPQLNTDTKIPSSGEDQHSSRYADEEASSLLLSATFELDEADDRLFQEKFSLGGTKRLIVSKSESGARIIELYGEDGICIEPDDETSKRILRTIPLFVQVAPEDLQIDNKYALNTFFDAKPPKAIPSALANLAAASGLNVNALFAAMKEGDLGRARSLLERANSKLKENFSEAWSQYNAEIQFDFSGHSLIILAKERDGDLEIIGQRSDGLIRFLLLCASLAKSSAGRKKVLLIDEAENHLHYDAQADLVEMLNRQTLASQVIYTTHSIGCLPKNLADGIRVVRKDGVNSHILNRFWSEQTPGASSLLFGMGAATVAFWPMRNCLICEGASDMILLHKMFEEVSENKNIPFTIVPGVAETGGGKFLSLSQHGRKIYCVVDNDQAGHKLRDKLVAAGLDDNVIDFVSAQEACVIEDIIDEGTYVKAVSSILARYAPNATTLKGKLSGPNRPKQVADLLEEQNIKAPSKVAVAYEIVEQNQGGRILAKEHRPHIESLLNNILELFQ